MEQIFHGTFSKAFTKYFSFYGYITFSDGVKNSKALTILLHLPVVIFCAERIKNLHNKCII